MHRLMLRPAVGAGEARPRREGDLKIDPSPAASKRTSTTCHGAVNPNAVLNNDN
jgi:hypothetical protein